MNVSSFNTECNSFNHVYSQSLPLDKLMSQITLNPARPKTNQIYAQLDSSSGVMRSGIVHLDLIKV